MSSATARRAAVAAAISAAALAAGLPSAAHAASVAYIDGDDVVHVNADGSEPRAVTADGSPESRYALPSADDAGNVVAARFAGPDRLLEWRGADGSRATNVLPWQIGAGKNAGPTYLHVRGDGARVVYNYLYSPSFLQAPEPRLAVTDPRAPGVTPEVDLRYLVSSSWAGDQLIASDTERIFAEARPAEFAPFLADPEASLLYGEVSRDHRRALVVDSTDTIQLAALGGERPPAASVSGTCAIRPQGKDLVYDTMVRAGLSPDGTQVTWSDAGGVHVATLPDRLAGGDCALRDARVLSATGSQPSFSAATLAAPAPPDPQRPQPGSSGGGTTPPPAPGASGRPGSGATPGTASGAGSGTGAGTGTGGRGGSAGSGASGDGTATSAAGDVRLAVGAGTLARTQLRRGRATVRLTTTAPGAVRVRLAAGRTTIATGSARASRAGTVAVRLGRPTARALRALRGRRTLTLVATLAPAGGGSLTATRAVRLR